MARKVSGPLKRLTPGEQKALRRKSKSRAEIAGRSFFHGLDVSLRPDGGDRVSEAQFQKIVAQLETYREEITYAHVRASNENYYKALSRLYAFAREVDRWPVSDRERLIVAIQKGRMHSKQTLFHVLLRSFIKYPDASARSALSRDARALLRAAKLGLTAKDFQKGSGGGFSGLDRMAREYSASQRKGESGPRRAPSGKPRRQEKPAQLVRIPLRGKITDQLTQMGEYVLVVTSMGDGGPPYLEGWGKVSDMPCLDRDRATRHAALAIARIRRELSDSDEE
ncbi:hypothetical protein [Phenylobacterium sp.]|uniref:hypothetical protein n=1 Tax=Phenylobacterium sp. TaxID=1871053 RepID=UPI002C80B717|nr:hypothetical protein [Phenylobacterium sp.]HLZ77155.1 hypothetical protein [Phenylobacterium sp.]